MTNLQCSVQTCTNNQSGYCCRPAIEIGGAGAHASAQTCCKSFQPVCSNAPSNCITYSQPNASLKIGCCATNCVHNEKDTCHALRVSVKTGHSGTQCASFRAG